MLVIHRITDEETQRQGDEAYELFQSLLEKEINEDTMPLPAKKFNKIIKKIEMESKAMLRGGLAEFLQFDEVMYESDKFEQRITSLV